MGYSYPTHVREHAIGLWRKGLTPTEVRNRLEDEAEALEIPDQISVSTIKAWVRGLERETTSRPWRMSMSDPADAAVIRDLLFDVARTPGAWLTEDEAVWAIRIRRLVANLEPRETYRLALQFVAAERAGDTSLLRELELLVLANPWDPRTSYRGMYLDLIDQRAIRGAWFRVGAAGSAPEAPHFEDLEGQQRHVAAVLRAHPSRATKGNS